MESKSITIIINFVNAANLMGISFWGQLRVLLQYKERKVEIYGVPVKDGEPMKF